MTKVPLMKEGDRRIETAAGVIEIVSDGALGNRTVTLHPHDARTYLARKTCLTSFPAELIEWLAGQVSFAWLCEALARHEDPAYVIGIIRRQVCSYLNPEEARGTRFLDFGCGSGASTFALGALLPESEVIGVELDPQLIAIARRIADHRKLANVRFLVSPSGDALPPDLGRFEYVMLSAVYEHLLPSERREVLPLLWSMIRPGGAIFVNQTPHRYFPYEHHSTGLWFINYLPAPIACYAARRWARLNPQSTRNATWPKLLRGGIRGGTERQIMHELTEGNSAAARILQPSQRGLRDRAAYWLEATSKDSWVGAKRLLGAVFRVSDRLIGTIPSVNIDVVIQKRI